MALEVAKKYKLAKSFAKEFLVIKGNIKDGNFDLPSGTTVDDVLKFVLDKMCKLEESQKKNIDSSISSLQTCGLYFQWLFCFCFVWTLPVLLQ